jgi:hypothetical protein
LIFALSITIDDATTAQQQAAFIEASLASFQQQLTRTGRMKREAVTAFPTPTTCTEFSTVMAHMTAALTVEASDYNLTEALAINTVLNHLSVEDLTCSSAEIDSLTLAVSEAQANASAVVKTQTNIIRTENVIFDWAIERLDNIIAQLRIQDLYYRSSSEII